MKVSLIDPSLFTWPYDVHLAKGLMALGHEVTIYGRNPGHTPTDDETYFLKAHFYPGFNSAFMQRQRPGVFLALKGLSHIESMVRLLRVLRIERPDVVHFQWVPLPVVDQCFIGSMRRIAPVVLTVHDSTPFNDNPKAVLQRMSAIGIMRRFDQLIVHTAAARARLPSYGIAPNKINIVPHGLLDDVASAGQGTRAASDGRVTLLLFGQIKPYKGADVLLRALALLPLSARQKCRLRIVGRPQMPMEPLFALVDELGLKANVEFDLRFVPDAEVAGILRQADIQMFPYRAIDASGVLMLVIPAGRAIVASNIGQFGELLQDGRHGALVPPDDPAALAQALQPLIEDTVRRQTCALAVQALASTIPSWTEIARQTEAVYRKVEFTK